MKIIITGSEGFIGNKLKSYFEKEDLYFIDNRLDDENSINLNNEKKLKTFFKNIDDFFLIHCAALRNDFGFDYEDYFLNNVTATENLLRVIEEKKIKKFIHISSVASIEGKILIEKKLFTKNSDDHYRKTKYLQESLVEDWAKKNKVPYVILAPSAIYDEESRLDTNIGKLKVYAKYLPFIPLIAEKKSLTNLSNFVLFIKFFLNNSVNHNKYLCIDQPVKSTSDIIQNFLKNKKLVIYIPFLKQFLMILSLLLSVLSFGGRIDTVFTYGRYKKLYKDTSYGDQNIYDDSLYNKFFKE